MQKILITSALPYANGPLHFGHIAGAYLPADCYARFERMRKRDVLYVCGSDEHGVAITLSAKIAGRSPKEHVDLYHELIQEFFAKIDMSFDHYSRTTWKKHVETTQEFFHDLQAGGYIEEKITPQLYSPDEKMFLADRYVVGICPKCQFTEARGDECPSCGASHEATDLIDPRSKLSGGKLIEKPTRHWFLRFDLFKEELNAWLKQKNWKANVQNFAKSYVDELRPRAITRDSEWGIPVPLEGAEGKVFYVWFDAPIGYISSSREWAEKKGQPDAWKDYWFDPQTKLVQFIGKDNIPFHAVFFPAMIMGQKRPYKLVDELPANEFLTLEGKQFSKSDGWYVDLDKFFEHFSSDQIRYAIAANAPESQDADFSWKDFQQKCNGDLLGKYGNLANRVLVFLQKNGSGKIPPLGELLPEDQAFLTEIRALFDEVEQSYECFHLRKATTLVMQIAQRGNAYFNDQKPWTLKSEEDKPRLATVLRLCLEGIKLLTYASCPLIPKTAEKLWQMIGFDRPISQIPWAEASEYSLEEGKILPTPSILFTKIEDEVIDREMDKLNELLEEKKLEESTFKKRITIDELSKIDLRVGQILEASAVEKSKKLLKFLVDLGTEKRTIVSGIALSYRDPDELIGKKVIVVANLKPAKLMGIESEGMILAADTEEGLELPFLVDPAAGSEVR